MRWVSIIAGLLVALVAVGLSGCDPDENGEEREEDNQDDNQEDNQEDNQGDQACDGESTAQLCEAFECGTATVIDRCGEERSIHCGECGEFAVCEEHQCVCIAESEGELCGELGAECGTHQVMDRCGEERSISCSDCEYPEECIQGTCRCEVVESEAELCAAGELGCGMATVVDTCGESREVSCGGCDSPQECEDNQCICHGESEAELCATIQGACGTIAFSDRCQVGRQVDCGNCAVGTSTIGRVSDAETGDAIEGAQIRVYVWPPAEGQDYSWVWPEGHREDDPDFLATTTQETSGLNFEIRGGEALCLSQTTEAALQVDQWYRFVVEADGYESAIFYRPQSIFESENCPESCAIDEEGSGCSRTDFEIWAEGSDRPRLPDLVADIRDIRDYQWQCAQLPDEYSPQQIIGLRVRMGAGNAGEGPLHLEALANDGGEVVQYIPRTDGGTDIHPVDSGTFSYVEQHRHVHFLKWFQLNLVEPIDACRDVHNRPDSCEHHQGTKISYCLHDLDPFDRDVQANYGGTISQFVNPPVCDTTTQGITQGWKDTYAKEIAHQLMIIGTPAQAEEIDTAWIEGVVDPEQVLLDRDWASNVVRLLVDPPEDMQALCEPGLVLDCTVDPGEYSHLQRWQCGDYFDWASEN